MSIKESSDELNPTIAVPTNEVAPPKRRRASDYLALAIATCGVGYFPLAPGTWGSMVGVGIYFLLRISLFRPPTDTDPLAFARRFIAAEILTTAVVTLVGIWAASRAERLLQVKDPSKVVIDEVAGQLVALMAVPLTLIGPWPVWVILAFLLFRAFDIIKPYPVRSLEELPSGPGIVLDDVAAGAYAGVLVALAWVFISLLS